MELRNRRATAAPAAGDGRDGSAPTQSSAMDQSDTALTDAGTRSPSASRNEANTLAELPPGRTGTAVVYNQATKKHQLVDFHAAPQYLRDNEYIRRHYRANWPLRQIFLSIFQVHNETLNIWTHLIGFAIFLALTIYTAQRLPERIPSLPQLPSFRHVFDAFDTHAKQIAVPSTVGSSTMERARDLLHSAEAMAGSARIQALERAKEMLRNAEELSAAAQRLMMDYWHASDLASHGSTVPRWPFFVFLAGAMACLLCSSTCHLLACYSAHVSRWAWRFDHCGIAVMIATSFFPPVFYGFLCKPLWRNLYLLGITMIGIGAMVMSLMPHFQAPKFRTNRALVFAGMGVSGVFPCLHKLLYYWNVPSARSTTLMEAGMGLLYLTGAAIYSARIPERWRPGMFDIVGSSHQIFHLFVVAGAYTHYQCGLHYLHWRDVQGCPDVGLWSTH